MPLSKEIQKEFKYPEFCGGCIGSLLQIVCDCCKYDSSINKEPTNYEE